LAKHAHGDASAADAGALNLATRRLEHLINHRRSVLVLLTEENIEEARSGAHQIAPRSSDHSYAVVNDRRLIVEPRTRRVIKIVE
jgi:hypothetical protein